MNDEQEEQELDLTVSQNGLELIKAFESCLRPVKGRPGYFKTYIDPVGVRTIGWGHTNHHPPRIDMSTVWSQKECDDALARDLDIFERQVNRLATVPLKQHEFDALVSWAYNTGGPRSSMVWKYVNSKRRGAVVAQLKKWNKGGGQVLRGLTRRRLAEGLMFMGEIEKALRVAHQ
jgi:lysozyme